MYFATYYIHIYNLKARSCRNGELFKKNKVSVLALFIPRHWPVLIPVARLALFYVRDQ